MIDPILGVVANARNSWPSMADTADLSVGVLRTIVYDNDELDAALQDVPPGVRILATINNEHRDVGADWSGWDAAIAAFAERFAGRVWAVVCGNEWDLLGVPVDDACRRTNAALRPLHAHDIRCVHGSVAGRDWQQALTESRALLEGYVDGVAFHPYGQAIANWSGRQPNFTPGLRQSLMRAAGISGKPVYVDEFGAKLSDYGMHVDPERQALYVREAVSEIQESGVCVVACYFAWRDDVGTSQEQGIHAFGLSTVAGERRPGWAALRDVDRGHQEVQPVPEFRLGFKTLADELGAGVVGEPLDQEHAGNIQHTTTGVMVWDPGDGKCQFYAKHKDTVVDRVTAAGDIWTAVSGNLPFVPGMAITDAWAEHPARYGPPLGPEHPTDDGGAERAFTSAIIRWHPDRGVTVVD